MLPSVKKTGTVTAAPRRQAGGGGHAGRRPGKGPNGEEQSPVHGKARQFLSTSGVTAASNHGTYRDKELKKREMAGDLLNRVLTHVMTPEGNQERVKAERTFVVHGTFVDEAMRMIRKDQDNFAGGLQAAITHLESKFEWVLKELGETADRLQTTMEKCETLQAENDVLIGDKESLHLRVEAMKGTMERQGTGFQDTKRAFERQAEFHTREISRLKEKLRRKHTATAALLRMGGGSMSPMAGGPSQEAIWEQLDDENTDDHSSSEQAEVLEALQSAQRMVEEDPHIAIINRERELARKRDDPLTKLKEELKKQEETAEKKIRNLDASLADLRQRAEVDATEMDEEREEMNRERKEHMQELGEQLFLQEGLKKHLNEVETERFQQAERLATLEEKLEDTETALVDLRQVHETSQKEWKAHCDRVKKLAEDSANNLIEESQTVMKKYLAERTVLISQRDRLGRGLHSALERLAALQRLTLGSPTTCEFLQWMRNETPKPEESPGDTPLNPPPPAAEAEPQAADTDPLQCLLTLADGETVGTNGGTDASKMQIGVRRALLRALKDNEPVKNILSNKGLLDPLGPSTFLPPVVQPKVKKRAVVDAAGGHQASNGGNNGNNAGNNHKTDSSPRTASSRFVPMKDIACQTLASRQLMAGIGGPMDRELQIIRTQLQHVSDERDALRQHVKVLANQLVQFPFLNTPMSMVEEYELKCAETTGWEEVAVTLRSDYAREVQRGEEKAAEEAANRAAFEQQITVLRDSLRQKEEASQKHEVELFAANDTIRYLTKETDQLRNRVKSSDAVMTTIREVQTANDSRLRAEVDKTLKDNSKLITHVHELEEELSRARIALEKWKTR